MDFMSIAIVALFLLCFLGFAIAGGKTWQWWHVVVLVFVLLGAAVFMALAGMTLKAHDAWRTTYNRLAAELETQTLLLKELKTPSLARPGASLPELRGQLGREMVDRGRVWRGVTPINIDANTITINMAGWGHDSCEKLGVNSDDEGFDADFLDPADGGEEGAVEPIPLRPHGIEQDIVLIAFAQAPVSQLSDEHKRALFGQAAEGEQTLADQDTEGVCQLPAYYLGDYKVTAVTPESIALQPVTALDAAQIERINNSVGTSWALYELMPIDRHDVFADMTEDQLRALLPQEATGLDDAAYADLLAEYSRDQEPIGPGANDPAERVRKKVRFLREYTVDADLVQEQPGLDRSFDASGRAQMPHLQHGEPIVFQAGDVSAYLDSETADELISSGVAENVDDPPPIYDRRLRDYLYAFREHEFQMNQLDQQIAVIQADQQAVLDATEKAREQIAFRTDERQKLMSDRDGFQRELTVLQGFVQQLQQRHAAQRRQLSELYRANRALMRGELGSRASVDRQREAATSTAEVLR